MISHLVQSMLLYTLLYGCYQLFLKRETFFQFNRFYLLSIPFVALLLPFLKLPIRGILDRILHLQQNEVALKSAADTEVAEVVVTTQLKTMSELGFFTSTEILLFIYGIGSCIAYILLCYKIAVIETFKEQATTQFMKTYRIMRAVTVQGGFSFLDMIFINPQAAASLNEAIIKHELVHVRQRHSWDLIMHESLRTLFWFNPFIHMAHKDLQATHEFIVDRELSQQDVHTYKSDLLQTILNCERHAFTNSYFTTSILKTRITMLQKSQSPASKLLKLCVLIPVVAFTLCYNAVAQQETVEPHSPDANLTAPIQLNYPKYSEFVYGKIDQNEGLTKEELELLKNKKDFNSDRYSKDFIDYLSTEEYAKIAKILAIQNANGVTVVRDDTDNNRLIEIREFGGSSALSTLGSHFVQGMTNTEYRAILRDLERQKPVSEFVLEQRTIDRIQKYFESTKKGDVKIEYKVETEELPTATSDNIPFRNVYKAPHFKECTGSPTELKQCTSDMISQFINSNFNTSVISKEHKGKHMIQVQFQINKEGNIEDISAKSKYPELQKEAFRVIGLIPQMIPGELENGQQVSVLYGLPIIFQTN